MTKTPTYKTVMVDFGVSDLENIKEEVEALKEEMETWRDNMEETLSSTSKFEQVSECCDKFEELDVDSLEWPDDIPGHTIKVPQRQNRNKNRPNSRGVRRDNVIAKICTVVEYLDNHADKEGVQDLMDTLGSLESGLSDIEFPSMY